MTDHATTNSRERIPWDGNEGRPAPPALYGAVAGCAVLGGYLATCSRTLSYGGDCGDLIGSSFVLGNCHPTGYPMYLVLGKLFAFLPVGDVAFRYNLFSAVAGAAAAGVMAGLVASLAACGLAGVFAGVCFGFLYCVWTQCLLAEVYALSLLLLCLLLLTAHCWIASGDQRWLLGVGLVAGLTAAHHLSGLTLGAPVVGYCLWVALRRRVAARLVTVGILLALSALALYAYLPLRAAAQPALNWGDPSTLGRFVAHVSGKLYHAHVTGAPLSAVPRRLLAYATMVGAQFLVSVVFLPLGVGALWKKSRGFCAALVLGWLLNLGVNLRYEVGDWWNFVLPSFLVLSVFVGVGAGVPTTWLARRHAHTSLPGAMPVLGLSAFLALQIMMATSAPETNLRHFTTAREFNEALLEQVPSGSALFVRSDENLFALQYLKYVEGKGTAITLLSEPILNARGHSFETEVERRLSHQRVFCSFYPDELRRKRSLHCLGLATEVLMSPTPLSTVAAVCESAGGRLTAAGLDLCFPSAVQGVVKKGNTAPVRFTWRIADTMPLHTTPELELVAVLGSPTEVDIDTPPTSDSAVATVSEVVTRWALRYRLAGGRNLRFVSLESGERVAETACFTVPWNCQNGRYQVFARLHSADGAQSVPVRLGEIQTTQR